MKSKDNGGPAFPDVQFTHNNGDTSFKNNGMSLRDWFAGQALAGAMTRASTEDEWPMTEKDPRAAIAKAAYGMADAMIAARSKEDAK